jgi:hypothetical protein
VSPEDQAARVQIGFPAKCQYRGGSEHLGRRGRRLRIKDGRIGHGVFRLARSIPLTDVASVDVTERQVGGTDAQTLMAFGVQPALTKHASPPKQITDVTVHTRDGQEARWVVEQRSADWVKKRLTPALRRTRIPYYDELPPGARAGP